jgi:hypothetical protein
MKQFILPVILLLSINAGAQKINLAKGKQIVITSTADQEMEMSSMGMQMKNNSSSTAVVEVKSVDNASYTTTYKLTKMKISMEAMGQQNSYDSEKPEDKDSEIGKGMGGKIGQETKVMVDKNSGKSTVEKTDTDKKDEPEENPFKGMMDSFGAADEGTTVESAFFVIPAGKKVGDVWRDSTINNKIKEVKTYTFRSLNGNEANISLFSTMDGTSSVEAQGMQMDLTVSAKSEGLVIVDTKTSLVKKRTSVTDVTGSIETMGQSMPMTSKVTAVINYN